MSKDRTTLDLTPNVSGVAAWARTVLAQAPADSPDADVARRILRECGHPQNFIHQEGEK